MTIPKRIIQTHKNPDIHAEYRKTWIDRNPGFEYLFFDDAGCEDFIKQHYPEYFPSYEKLPLKAQKADFFRYLAVHRLGGVYSDVDTVCKEALANYIDFETASLVVGIEMTLDLYKHELQNYLLEYALPRQFAQWSFAASAGNPMLEALTKTIHRTVSLLSKQQLAELSQTARTVLEITGPMAFTQAIRFQAAYLPDQTIQILPQLYWGYSPWHNPDVNPRQHPDVKLVHLFHGSWRNP